MDEMIEWLYVAVDTMERSPARARFMHALISEYNGAKFTQDCHPEYEGNNGYVTAMERVLKHMAAMYEDFPGFNPDWHPMKRIPHAGI